MLRGYLLVVVLAGTPLAGAVLVFAGTAAGLTTAGPVALVGVVAATGTLEGEFIGVGRPFRDLIPSAGSPSDFWIFFIRASYWPSHFGPGASYKPIVWAILSLAASIPCVLVLGSLSASAQR